MISDRQEQSGLLSAEHDEDSYLESARGSPAQSFNGELASLGRVAYPYKITAILVFAQAMAISTFQVIFPFISKF